MNTSEAFCPECGHRLRLGPRSSKGQRILCSMCETNLTLVSLNPPEVEVSLSPLRTSRKKGNTVEVACPECEADIRLSVNAREGQELVCEQCDTLLEVVSTDPIELDVALMINVRHNRWQKSKRS